MKLYALFSNGALDPDMLNSVVLGPYDPSYVELTYNLLRVAPEGDNIAVLGDDGYWHIIVGTESINPEETIKQIGQWHAPIIGETLYSDVDIYWKED